MSQEKGESIERWTAIRRTAQSPLGKHPQGMKWLEQGNPSSTSSFCVGGPKIREPQSGSLWSLMRPPEHVRMFNTRPTGGAVFARQPWDPIPSMKRRPLALRPTPTSLLLGRHVFTR